MKHTGITDGSGRTVIVEEAQSTFDAIYAPRGWVTATQTEADAYFGAPEPDDTFVTTAQLNAALAGFTPSGGSSVASLTPTAVRTSAYTAAASDYVPVDTTSGPVTVTLPSAPADKTQVGVKHVARGGANAVTIACAGSDVLNKTGGSTTGTLTLLNQGAVLQYKASTAVWYVVSDDLPLSQLDARYQAPRTVVSKTTTYTAASGDIVLANAASGAFVVTLPAASTGGPVTVKKVDSTSNAVTITPASGTVDGAATVALTSQYASRDVVSDGTNWFQV